jgi:hypothetical protein
MSNTSVEASRGAKRPFPGFLPANWEGANWRKGRDSVKKTRRQLKNNDGFNREIGFVYQCGVPNRPSETASTARLFAVSGFIRPRHERLIGGNS